MDLCPLHQTQLRVSPYLLCIHFGVSLSSCSVTAPLTIEVFERKYGDHGRKVGDGISQRSPTQFIPLKMSWDCGNISWQPPADRYPPLWSLKDVCPSLVSTIPRLPWSSIARHLLAAATCDRFSACHRASPRSSSHYSSDIS